MLVYSTAESGAVKSVQGRLGVEEAGAMVERAIAAIARGLVERGVRQLVVAGGETSGACVQALGIAQLQIGAQIDPGVPWCHAPAEAAGGAGLHIALKSGNFGTDDFFTKAFTVTRMTRERKRAKRSAASAAACSSAATCMPPPATSACGSDDGFLITPTDACLGFLDPARLARLDAGPEPDRRRSRQQDHRAACAHLRRRQALRRRHALRDPHPQHALRRAHAATRPGEELLPALTPYFVMKVGHVPLIPYHRPGAPEAAEQVAQAIERYGARGTPIRAVMLERLGPNVWHDTPAAAMAVLEELEETARLWLHERPAEGRRSPGPGPDR